MTLFSHEGLSYREGWVLVLQFLGTKKTWRPCDKFCCSAFNTNSFRTRRNPQGESIKFYGLPRDPEVQAAYTRILRTTGINWHSGHICAGHWSRGYRENASADFPDVPVPASQLVALQKKLKQAKAQLERKATKLAKRKVSSLERKLFSGQAMFCHFWILKETGSNRKRSSDC